MSESGNFTCRNALNVISWKTILKILYHPQQFFWDNLELEKKNHHNVAFRVCRKVWERCKSVKVSSVFYLKAITVKCKEAADYDGLLVTGHSLCLALRLGNSRVQLEVGVERILSSGLLHWTLNLNISTDNLHPDIQYHYYYYRIILVGTKLASALYTFFIIIIFPFLMFCWISWGL